ncbi:hypothetical protein KP509_07G008500 [Ceratopteris richardii]|uniref:Uncharacterized protein n=1 Tax=Ceratopteris richardii TaxID=49495 RepID=A0A8T2U9P8_CERRI|nr:hypothetical protein KP509_07G008500 [Ceratopteris richardii]
MEASALSHFFLGPLSISRKGTSVCRGFNLYNRIAISCASYKEDSQVTKQSIPLSTPSVLDLPLASQSSQSPPESNERDVKPAVGAAGESSQSDAEILGTALRALGKTSSAQLAIYGGIIAGGIYLVESILNSFDGLPLLPETLQLVGVLYAIVLGSRLFQGKPVSLTPSPVKAIIELVDREGTLVQKTNLDLPQDLDVRIKARILQLSRERDEAVNKMKALERRVADFARVVAEKEALEAVAVQLAQERDEAMSEVIALKQAVDAMSDRMRNVENSLQSELEPLKRSSQALETVALQLASERDSALKELSDLKEQVNLSKYNEEEKAALESLALKLAAERDEANLENQRMKELLGKLSVAGKRDQGLSSEQEASLKERISASGMQFIDMSKPYEDQKEEVDKFVAHLVENYGAPAQWTEDYLKDILKDSSFKVQELQSSTTSLEEMESSV